VEYNDVYDKERNLTGRTHLRGTPWRRGEFGYVACVWVYDSAGRILMTQRAPEKSFAGTWENSGGAVKAGETGLQAIARELFEETGIRAKPEEFVLIDSGRDGNTHFDYYCLHKDIPVEQVVLQPGETVGAKWVTFAQIHEMIRRKQICHVIAHQFLRQEQMIKAEQSAQESV